MSHVTCLDHPIGQACFTSSPPAHSTQHFPRKARFHRNRPQKDLPASDRRSSGLQTKPTNVSRGIGQSVPGAGRTDGTTVKQQWPKGAT